MEDLGSLWTTYHESTDELKQKLLYATLEVESVKTLATNEIRKREENVKELFNHLKLAYKERDDARDELDKLKLLLNKIMPSSPIEAPINMFPHVHPESPLLFPTKANSSITESNSLSETYNPQSHGSSPVESLFDAVSSPEFSNINMAESGHVAFVKQQQQQQPQQPQQQQPQQPLVQDFNCTISAGAKIDAASARIDKLVKGKTLPQKGNLLQAVMEAGPLLKTLLVAGPLPRWRNPPPLQLFKIPPVSIKGSEAASFDMKPVVNPSYAVDNKPMMNLALASYPEMSRGFSQTCSASMLNFNNAASGSCLNNARMMSSNSSIDHQIPIGKRQRLQ